MDDMRRPIEKDKLEKMDTKRVLAIYRTVRTEFKSKTARESWEPGEQVQLEEYIRLLKSILDSRENIE